jgi:hypothetical protein
MRKRYCSCLFLVAVTIGFTGCGSPGRSGVAVSTTPTVSTPATAQSPSEAPEVTYRAPTIDAACAAVAAAGIPTSYLDKEKVRCSMMVGANKHQRYALHLEVNDGGSATGAKNQLAALHEVMWTGKMNAFVSSPDEKADVNEVGTAKAGVDFDECFYATYGSVTVAGVKMSQMYMDVRRSNVILEFSLYASDKPGKTSRPAPVATLKGIFAKLVPAEVALVKPAPSSPS